MVSDCPNNCHICPALPMQLCLISRNNILFPGPYYLISTETTLNIIFNKKFQIFILSCLTLTIVTIRKSDPPYCTLYSRSQFRGLNEVRTNTFWQSTVASLLGTELVSLSILGVTINMLWVWQCGVSCGGGILLTRTNYRPASLHKHISM